MSGPPPNQPAQNPYYQPGYPTYPAPQFQPPYQGQAQPPPAQQYPPPTYPTYPTYPNPPANSQTTVYVHEEVVVRPARQPTVVVGIGAGLAAMAAGVVIGEALADGNHHHHHHGRHHGHHHHHHHGRR